MSNLKKGMSIQENIKEKTVKQHTSKPKDTTYTPNRMLPLRNRSENLSVPICIVSIVELPQGVSLAPSQL
jgi:hypothetical protein